jgi:hypothetical protein
VVRGWIAQTQRASRLHLPDITMVDAVTAARCELLLNGPPSASDIDHGDDVDPAAFLLGVAELVRLGDKPSIWVPDIATQLERSARAGTQISSGAVEAAARVLHAAGEHRAVDDLRRMTLAVVTDPPPDLNPGLSPGLVPSWVERHLVVSDEHCAQLMPWSFPEAWLGVDFEAHGLAIGLGSTLSFAIRWHGDRPAVLWEVSGAPMPLAHDSWTTGQLSGEALWPPVMSAPTSSSDQSQSFS